MIRITGRTVRSAPLLILLVTVSFGAVRPASRRPDAAAAARFLQQASWGPTAATVAHVQDIGFAAYIEEQFAATPSTISVPPPDANGNTSLRGVQDQFFFNAVSGEDQLRQRVMFALNQIWVVSGLKITDPAAMVNYLQVLQRDAFTNYYDVMYDVTLSPAMGHYLDMVNNDKPNPRTGRGANENYAREFMQLFTIGLSKLHLDGTPMADASGNPIPTYTQDTIEGFARAFTGWTYAPAAGAEPKAHNPANWTKPMVPWNANHDTDPKELLNGVILPPRQTAEEDLRGALNNVFNHPNVGPFVCRQLIQHLVTSNPSPAYVARVVRVFDGTGLALRPEPGTSRLAAMGRGVAEDIPAVRGDMEAVIGAILLDREARQGDDAVLPPGAGHLREPVLFINSLLRALNATVSPGNGLAPAGSILGQNIYFPPTVFNYFAPDYEIPGTTVNAPEFQILSPATAMLRADFVNSLAYGKIAGVSVDFTPFIQLSANANGSGDTARMLNVFDAALMWGRMPADMRGILAKAVGAAPSTRAKVQAAIYLIATSWQYQVER